MMYKGFVIVIFSLLMLMGSGGMCMAEEYVYKAKADRPYGVAVGADGTLFVVCAPPTGAGTLYTVAPDGIVKELAVVDGTFIGPGIAIDEKGNPVITVGERLVRIGEKGKAAGLAGGFLQCFDVELDPKGNAYVAETGLCTITRVAPDGKKRLFSDSKPKNPVPFTLMGIAINSWNDALYAAEGSRILKYAIRSDGTASAPEVLAKGMAGMRHIAVDSVGNVYVTTANAIKRLSKGNVETICQRAGADFIGMCISETGSGEVMVYAAAKDGVIRVVVR